LCGTGNYSLVHLCGTGKYSLVHLCGTGKYSLVHLCGTGKYSLVHLCGTGKFKVMSEFHKQILTDSKDLLLTYFNPDVYSLDAMIQCQALTNDEYERVKSVGPSWKKQTKMMLKCLRRKPDSAFRGFLNALLLTEQHHLAHSLLERGNLL